MNIVILMENGIPVAWVSLNDGQTPASALEWAAKQNNRMLVTVGEWT